MILTKAEFETRLDQTLADIRTLIIQSETYETLATYVYEDVDGYASIARVAQYLAIAKTSQNVFDLLKKPKDNKDNVVPFKVVKNEEEKQDH